MKPCPFCQGTRLETRMEGREMETIFFANSGLQIRYAVATRMLLIDDLNPEASIQWRISRWELAIIGLKALLASISRK